jgi:hypothetical protein
MPVVEYESRTDSVLAWKKAQKLGRFDPEAGTIEQQKIRASEREVDERGKSYSLLQAFEHVFGHVYGYGSKTRQKQVQSHIHGGRGSCSSYLPSSINRRCFRWFLNWIAAYLQASAFLPILRPMGEGSGMSHPVFICEHGAIRERRGRMAKSHPHYLRSYNARHAKLPLRASCIFCLGRAESLPWDVRWRSRFHTVIRSTEVLLHPFGNRLDAVSLGVSCPVRHDPSAGNPSSRTEVSVPSRDHRTRHQPHSDDARCHIQDSLIRKEPLRRIAHSSYCGVQHTKLYFCSCAAWEGPLAYAVH